MRTALCDLLGIDVPVVQAAIGSAAGPALAAAVSNAGGLGTLVLTGLGGDRTRAAMRRTRELTSKPFVANLVLPFDIADEMAAMLEEGPDIVSLFWGDPAPHAARIHAAGARLMVTVGSIDEACRAVDAGADIVVAQGWEAGGHVRGTTATLALVPAVVDAIAPVPVVAAGGIADGRGLAAVLALGAGAAWIGTRFLAATEADTHPDYRARVLAATAADTVYCTLYDTGWPDAPARVLRTPAVEAWERAGRPGPGQRPGEDEAVAREADGSPILRYEPRTPCADMTGDIEAMSHWAGQGVGLVRRAEPAGDIVRGIVAEARAVLRATGELR